MGISGVLILFAAATTSFSGITRLGRTRSPSTACCPASSGGSSGERSSRARRSPRRRRSRSGLIVVPRSSRRRSRVSREPLLLRRPDRVHSGPARRDPAASQEPELERPFRARPNVRSAGVRLPLAALVGAPLTFVDLGARDDHAPGCALRRPGLARSSVSASTWSSGAGASVGLLEDVAPDRDASDGRRVRADARADEARRHRRGDGRDRDRAREGAWRDDRGDHRRARAAQVPARRRAARRTSPRASRRRSTRRGRSGRSTASRCTRHRRVPARSATRSSTRPEPRAPI